jgi:hypothetical protein
VLALFFRVLWDWFQAEEAAQFGKIWPVRVVVRIGGVHKITLLACHHPDMGLIEKPDLVRYFILKSGASALTPVMQAIQTGNPDLASHNPIILHFSVVSPLNHIYQKHLINDNVSFRVLGIISAGGSWKKKLNHGTHGIHGKRKMGKNKIPERQSMNDNVSFRGRGRIIAGVSRRKEIKPRNTRNTRKTKNGKKQNT